MHSIPVHIVTDDKLKKKQWPPSQDSPLSLPLAEPNLSLLLLLL